MRASVQRTTCAVAVVAAAQLHRPATAKASRRRRKRRWWRMAGRMGCWRSAAALSLLCAVLAFAFKALAVLL